MQHLHVLVCMAVLTTLLLCRLVQCPQSCSPPLQLPCSLLGGYSVCLSLVPHSWELEDLGKWFGAGRLVGKKSGSHLVGKKIRLPPFPAKAPVADPRCFLSMEVSTHPQLLLHLPGSKDFRWSFQKTLTRYTR